MCGQTVVGQWSRSNLVDQYRNSVLACATRWSCLLTIKLLIHRSACIYTDHNKHEDALVLAATAGKTDIVGYLLEKGARVNKPDQHGNYVLAAAASLRIPELVRLVLEHGAEVNRVGSDKETALGRATRRYAPKDGGNKVLCMLLNAGADPDILSPCGQRPFLSAFDHFDYFPMRHALTSQERKNYTVSRRKRVEEMVKGYPTLMETFKLFVEKGADLNQQNKDGDTILMLSVRAHQHDMVEFLVTKQANISLQNNKGRTALMIACAHGLHDIASLLLERSVEFFKHYSDMPQTIIGANDEDIEAILRGNRKGERKRGREEGMKPVGWGYHKKPMP